MYINIHNIKHIYIIYNIKQETRYTIEYFFRKIPNIKHQNQNKHKILAFFIVILQIKTLLCINRILQILY